MMGEIILKQKQIKNQLLQENFLCFYANTFKNYTK